MEDVIDTLEFRRQSFIVRVWLEELENTSGEATWHGFITHVPSGDNSYVSDLDEITSFIAKYLREMGARVKLRREICTWLRWLNRDCAGTSNAEKKTR